jgi:hypothetical protein
MNRLIPVSLRPGVLVLVLAMGVLTGCGSNSVESDTDSRPLVIDTLMISADARLATEFPGIALGLTEDLIVGTIIIVGGPSYVNQSLIGLPAAPLPLDSIELSSATLILTCRDSLYTLPSQVEAFAVKSSWDEATVTWLSRPPTDSISQQTVSLRNHQLRFDVASLYLDSTFANGLLLASDAADLRLYSSDDADTSLRPMVEFMYRIR